MKSLMIAAAALAVASVALPAAAQDQSGTAFYGNLGYAFVDARGVDVNLGAIGGKLGARFNPYIGAEVEAAFGVNDDTVKSLGVPVKVELKHSIGAYAVGFLPVKPNFDLFARVGYANTKIKASALGAALSSDGNTWNAGLGGQYFFTAKDGVRAEYTKYDIGNSDAGLDANVWTVSYVRAF